VLIKYLVKGSSVWIRNCKISITLEGLKLPEGGSKLGGDGDEGGDSHDKGKFDSVDDLDDPHDDQFADKK
jgi:hypothetical protein